MVKLKISGLETSEGLSEAAFRVTTEKHALIAETTIKNDLHARMGHFGDEVLYSSVPNIREIGVSGRARCIETT